MIGLHRFVCHGLDSIAPRSVIITHMGVIISIVVIHKGCLADILSVISRSSPVMKAVRRVHILRPYEYPPAIRAIVREAGSRA